MSIQAAPTVRESLESAAETVLAEEIPVQETPPAEPIVEAKGEAPAQETEAAKAGRTAGRVRDEKGRLLPGKVEVPPVVPIVPKAPRPSSWKKELEPHWDTLPPEIQSYIGERERQYATGVSTYKTEADRAKGVMQAISQFEPTLQKHGIPVDQWITNLGNAHHTLSLGSPQDKVNMIATIIRNNGVDANALFQLMSGQQPVYQQPQQQAQPQFGPQEIQSFVQKSVQESLTNAKAEQEYRTFTEATDKYPHFEAVKATMAGLLQAGLAQDYQSAYEAAVRMPAHANIWDAMQEQQNTQKEAERLASQKAVVGRARSAAVSVKSSTPTAMTQTEGAKSLHAQLSDAFDKHQAGRV